MKRLWIGIGLLAAIMIAGFWTSSRMADIHIATSDILKDSVREAQAGQWEQVDRLAEKAQSCWKKSWNFSATMADHTVLDEIDGLFAQADIYRKNRTDVEYAATCAQLATAIEALQESHRLSWWNLL